MRQPQAVIKQKQKRKGGLDTFLAYEIDNIAAGNDQTIHEIFADNDNGNDDEFEGFDPEDIDLNNENGRTDLFDSVKWGVGSRQNQEPLTFSTVPGRRVPLSETTTVSDYFNIFIKDDDFEEIATETNRYAEQYFENNQNLGTFSRFRKWQTPVHQK